MIRKDCWEGLKKRGVASVRLETGCRLRSLSGHLIPTLGVAQIPLYGTVCPFFVVKELQHDMLLGTDVMLLGNANIVYNDHTVSLRGRVHHWGIGRDVEGGWQV